MKNIKKAFSIIIAIMLLFSTYSNYVYADNSSNQGSSNIITDLFTYNRTSSVNQVKKGETFTISYSIKPNDIPVSSIPGNKQKDIILIMDTSGSMKWVPDSERMPSYGEKSRLTIIKEVAKKFIDKFKDDGKGFIGIVEYDDNGKVTLKLTNVKSNNINSVYSIINNMSAGGSTNIGDGIRNAYYEIQGSNGHEKYVILMTDGIAEAYSTDKKNNYYLGSGTPYYTYKTYWYYWFGKKIASPDYREEGMEYAVKAAQMLGYASIKTFVVGFGEGTDSNKNLKIAKAANGVYYDAYDEETINNIYDQIQKIIAANVEGSFHFEETFSSNLEVSGSLPEGFRIEGNKIVGDVTGINYRLEDNVIKTDPYDFNITFKAKDEGPYYLGHGGNTSKLTYNVTKDYTGQQTLFFPELKIDSLINTEISIEVKDSTGTVDVFDSNDITPYGINYSKIISNITLKGDAFANIIFRGQTANFFQYQFINSTTVPAIPDTGYTNLSMNLDTTNNDVVLEKAGYLNQRPYNVEHMATMSNVAKWENPDEVFKNPFEATTIKPAAISTNKAQYGKFETYLKPDGTTGTRWAANSVFMSNINIGGDYKEASKFWGYIKAPESGDYKFGLYSDDGARGYITIDGAPQPFADMFKVQSSTWGTTDKVFSLEAGKFYPIYLEYFNWGGWAHYEMKYSKKGAPFITVPSDWFYPSKNIQPGESATAIFTGSSGIEFPPQPGDYYIVFRTGYMENGIIKSIEAKGIYGPFKVEASPAFTLTRQLYGNTEPAIGDQIQIKYTIQPDDLPVKNIYANPDSSTPTTYQVTFKNAMYQDTLPEGLQPVGSSGTSYIINGNKVNGSLAENIIYTLYKPTSNPVDWVYRANPITYIIYANALQSGTMTLDGSNAALTYEDINGLKKQINFPSLSFEVKGGSDIIKHGIYINQPPYIKESVDGFRVTDKIPVKFGLLVDIKSDNSVLNISFAGDVKTEKILFEKYELNNGLLDSRTRQSIEKSGSSFQFKTFDEFTFTKGKQYIITYIVKPNRNTGTLSISTNIDGGNQKILVINVTKLPGLK